MVNCTRSIIWAFLLACIVPSRAFSTAEKTRLGPRLSSSASASPAAAEKTRLGQRSPPSASVSPAPAASRLTKAAPIVLSTILYRFPAYAADSLGGSLASPMGDKLDGSGTGGAETAFQWFFLLYVFGSLAVGAKEILQRANNQLNKDK